MTLSDWLTLLLGAAGVVLLCFGADYLVRGGVALARLAKVPVLVIGLTVVAFGTSAPELVVSSTAALRGSGDIAIGNVVGSNICNIALILGASALVRPLPVNRSLFKLDMPAMIISSLLLVVWSLVFDGVGRVGGAIFFIGFICYIARRFYNARHDKEEASSLAGEAEDVPLMRWYSATLLVIIALAMLVAGARFFISGAVRLAELFNVSQAVIGLTVVALGTSLPELATSIAAAIRGECDIALGNVIGSNLFNVLCILGIAPLISPLQVKGVNGFDFAVMMAVSFGLAALMYKGKNLSRWAGLFLLLIYVLYMAKLIYAPNWGA